MRKHPLEQKCPFVSFLEIKCEICSLALSLSEKIAVNLQQFILNHTENHKFDLHAVEIKETPSSYVVLAFFIIDFGTIKLNLTSGTQIGILSRNIPINQILIALLNLIYISIPHFILFVH